MMVMFLEREETNTTMPPLGLYQNNDYVYSPDCMHTHK